MLELNNTLTPSQNHSLNLPQTWMTETVPTDSWLHKNETLSWGFRQFFPTGTNAGIGTTCVEFENVMKSAMNKKKLPQTITVLFRFTHFRRNKLLCDKAPAVLSEFLGPGFAVKCFLHIQSWYILLLVGNCQLYPIKALWFYLTNKFQTLGIETLF